MGEEGGGGGVGGGEWRRWKERGVGGVVKQKAERRGTIECVCITIATVVLVLL